MTPLALPVNKFPSRMVGCENADVSPSYANAHLSFSRSTPSSVSPAAWADWYRALLVVGLQPFHSLGSCNLALGASRTARSAQYAVGGIVAAGAEVPRYEATASRSAMLIV